MDNAILLTKFYTAFKYKDHKEMGECYHKNIVFEDPAFGILNGNKAKYMWEMLCQNGNDLVVSFNNINVDENKGTANWEAHYTFSTTSRKVHNVVAATFEFKDGLIIKHTDNFSFNLWAKQAFGIVGLIFGNMSFFQKTFKKQANILLEKHISKHHGK